MIIFKKSKNFDLQDGENYLVVFPDGSVKLSYYSRKCYFRSIVNYSTGSCYLEESIEDDGEVLIVKVECED